MTYSSFDQTAIQKIETAGNQRGGWLTRQQVQASGIALSPEVLVVPGLGVAAFQLDRSGVLHPIVAEVNKVLGALNDPLGVASWWLHPHARLSDRAPADLIGDDELLRSAASWVGDEP